MIRRTTSVRSVMLECIAAGMDEAATIRELKTRIGRLRCGMKYIRQSYREHLAHVRAWDVETPIS